jgi:hypothetical protein
VTPQAPNKGENTQIANGATTRRREEEEERGRGAGALFFTEVAPTCLARLLHESRQNLWRDWFDMAQWPPSWRTGHAPVPRVTLVHMAQLLNKLR